MRRELTKMIAFVVCTALAGSGAGFALAGCSSDTCARNSDCKAGQECTVDGTCVMRSDDSTGDDDSSTTDAAVETVDASEASVIDAPVDAE